MSEPPNDRAPRTRLPLTALAVLVAACDASTAPDLEAFRLVPTSGVDQRGLPHEALPLPLVVQVVDPSGRPAVGTGVSFRAAAGSGAVEVMRGTTNADGTAVARWTLGSLPRQEVVATVQGASAGVSFTATLLPREEADLIVVAGQGNTDVSLIAYDAGAFDPLEAYQARITDSIAFLPFDHPSFRDEVAAFARGRRPTLLSPVPWTTGRRDTLHVPFREPVAIPITVWVVKGPFRERAELVRTHARLAEEVWDMEGMGVRFGELDLRDATGHPRAADFHGRNPNPCGTGVRETIGRAEGRINVYYVGGVGEFAGYACANDYVLMAEQSGRWPTLLAHELGHTFGLSHDQFGRENVMNANPGGQLTSGQIFHAHFQRYSALNAVYRTYPPELQRDCRVRLDGSPAQGSRACMPASYDLF